MHASCEENPKLPVIKKWVGVHVRRFPDRHKVEAPPSPESIVQQVNKVLSVCEQSLDHDSVQNKRNVMCKMHRLSPCCALIFSNDPPWCKEHIINITCVRFVENEFLPDPGLMDHHERNNGWATNFGRDMAAMAVFCDYLILTVGTFGYFSGILHGQQRDREVYVYARSTFARLKYVPSTWELWK